MSTDGGIPDTAGRVNALLSLDHLDVPTLLQCLSLDPVSLGNQNFMRSGELRRALGFPLVNASEDHMFRVSSSKPFAPVAIEDLKHYKENIVNACSKAKDRSKLFRTLLYKLDKCTEAIGSKKRQRSDPLLNEKPGGSILLKTASQLPRSLPDQSVQRLEDRAKSAGINKRFRSSAVDLKVDIKLGSLSKDQMGNVKDTIIAKSVGGPSVQPEERMVRLSAVGEGWDQNMKRKRSNGTVTNRSVDNDMKRPLQTKLNSNTKLATCDTSVIRLSNKSNRKQETSGGSPGTNAKGKISRAPRTGSLMIVNSSDGQASSEACEGWEQPSSANKVISLGLMQNNHTTAISSEMIGPWGNQRQKKGFRSRRPNAPSPVTNHEGPTTSLNSGPPAVIIRSPLNGDSGAFDTNDVHNMNSTPYTKTKFENTPSPGLSSEVEEILGYEHEGVEEKGKDTNDVALKGKSKVGASIFPTKKNKNFLNENGVDRMRRQGRTVKGLSLSGAPQSEVKLENGPTIKHIQNARQGSEKIRGKSGRPPSKKMSDGRVTRKLESDDDHEELLAAATAARKARCLSCSSRLWKKMEPVFGPVSSQDISHLKQQLSLAEELEDNHSLVSCTENVLGLPMNKRRADVPFGRKGSESNQLVDTNELVPVGLTGEKNEGKFTSLYQRVLCALIEEDENEGLYNGYEGASVSFQCASDDSHCGSCNYADADTRDRDRFESEAESIVDFQIPKRYSGDRFSCNKSVTSNATWNTSMSDSLYSSGRWLGDDGLSYSDAEFIGGSYQNDIGAPQAVTASGACFDDCQYELMCIDDKLMMELQSIGLYPDAMPDLTEGEVIDHDITELNEGLYDQIGKKKVKLVKIDSAVHDDNQRERRFVEQVAMDQLVQMAYKRRMAYRRNNTSKAVLRKVSKQVAMGFIERTLARCEAFEATGRSCFSEPAFQNLLFAAQGTDAGINSVPNAYIGQGAPKHRNPPKAGSVSLSLPDSCVDDFSGGCIDSAQNACHLPDDCFPKLESSSHKIKKRELLLDNVGGASINATTKYGRPRIGKLEGKASLITNTMHENLSVGGLKREEKPKIKTKLKVSTSQTKSSSIQREVSVNKKESEMRMPSSCNDPKDISETFEEPVDFDSIAENDASAPVDLNDWFKDLPDGDFGGCLDIPMDDLSMVI